MISVGERALRLSNGKERDRSLLVLHKLEAKLRSLAAPKASAVLPCAIAKPREDRRPTVWPPFRFHL